MAIYANEYLVDLINIEYSKVRNLTNEIEQLNKEIEQLKKELQKLKDN